MKRRWRVLGGLAAIGLLGLGVFAGMLAKTDDCTPPPTPATGDDAMPAVLARCYGPPEVLEVARVARPELPADRVLVRVHAASANPLDWHAMRGEPYFMRLSSGFGTPDDARVGVDFAGVVEAVGAGVTGFRPGDAVFGAAPGAFAEYVVARPDRIVAKPAQLDFAQAAAIPVAAITALQALRDKAKVQPGQRVLINGASGGVGTFAVQIAKALGAEVTGVCSTRNVELVRGLGADRVVDYTAEDFTRADQRWDVIVDTVGNHGLFDLADVLADDGVLVMVGSRSDEPFLGPGWRFLRGFVADPFMAPRVEGMLAEFTDGDLDFLASLVAQGKLRPAIDRRFPLADAAEAIRYLETGRARGKVVIDVP
jgi:NADPH:quinone reductase-like Zn-dependent oxidoreductase